jgi:hypothetical protein
MCRLAGEQPGEWRRNASRSDLEIAAREVGRGESGSEATQQKQKDCRDKAIEPLYARSAEIFERGLNCEPICSEVTASEQLNGRTLFLQTLSL